MKKLALSLLIISSFANARTIEASGEYRYGPDTAQNLACSFAEDRAKENALKSYLGEEIEFTTFEQCTNGRCTTQRDTLNEFNGYIKKVIKRTDEVTTTQGYSSCVVNIVADVQPIDNDIRLTLPQSQYNYRENDEVKFQGAVNRPGKLLVFNVFNDVYQLIHSQFITANNVEFMIPSKTATYKLVAELPKGASQSKEKVVFMFIDKVAEKSSVVKEKYTQMEFINFLSTIPPQQRKVVNRFVLVSK